MSKSGSTKNTNEPLSQGFTSPPYTGATGTKPHAVSMNFLLPLRAQTFFLKHCMLP
jgi:hypothetical protein